MSDVISNLSALKHLSKLRELTLISRNGSVLDEVNGLEELVQLESLNMGGLRSDWEFLRSLDKLETLYVQSCKITNIDYFCEMNQLSYLAIWNCDIADKQKEQLAEALPGCRIDYRND